LVNEDKIHYYQVQTFINKITYFFQL
jgi:hypothetical protein